LLETTHPGTEIKVTPDREAPIIPKATTNQGDFLSPRKKESFPAPFPDIQEMPSNKRKYAAIMDMIRAEDIVIL